MLAAVVTTGPEGRGGDAEANLLAFHVAAGLVVGSHLVDAELREQRVAALLVDAGDDGDAATKMMLIAASSAQPWRVSPTILPNM